MNHQQAEQEAQLMQAHREELVERIARAMREDGTAQPIQGLHLSRRSSLRAPIYGVLLKFHKDANKRLDEMIDKIQRA